MGYNGKKLGFGCMRLPMKDKKVIREEFSRMIDTFMEKGFNYFDTAHGYLDGESELALRDCLTERYPRESYILTNKLSTNFFSKKEDIIPFFEKQLECCGVSYFDYYLMHAQDKELYEKYKKCEAYETALELKAQGKFRHFGISFHDKPELLERILTEYPEIEAVQIQFNYADYEDPAVESKNVYEICRKFGKDIIIMEPIKGGSLVNLPDDAAEVLNRLNGGSIASYAIRFAAGFEGVIAVLSGMGDMNMVEDNISYMDDFVPLNEKELDAVKKVTEIFREKDAVPCTACGYCLSSCPKNIPIPELFACINRKKLFNNWNTDYYYSIATGGNGKASDCIGCRSCEKICPQHLEISSLMKEVAREFEK